MGVSYGAKRPANDDANCMPSSLPFQSLNANSTFSVSPVNLIEGPRIRETAVPDFIDNPCCMFSIFANRSGHYRKHGSSPHTFLVLVCQFPLASCEEFSRPPAFAAQR